MPQSICFSKLRLGAGHTNIPESENPRRFISTKIGGNPKRGNNKPFCADAGGTIPGEELSGGRIHSNLATTLPCQSCVLVKPLEALIAGIFGEDLNHIQATT